MRLFEEYSGFIAFLWKDCWVGLHPSSFGLHWHRQVKCYLVLSSLNQHALKNEDRCRLKDRYRSNEALGWVRCSCCQGGTHGGALSQPCRLIDRKKLLTSSKRFTGTVARACASFCSNGITYLQSRCEPFPSFSLCHVFFVIKRTCWILNMHSWQQTIPGRNLIVNLTCYPETSPKIK